MTLQLWLVYCIAAVGLSLTPGPNGLLVLTHAMRYGLRPTVYTALGGVSGFFLLVAASLAGLGALLAASERAFTVTKWLGAGYLIYLGIRTWFAAPPSNSAINPQSADYASSELSRWMLARQGFLVAISNPKALIFFAAFLPQFMQPQTGYWTQLLVLGGTFVVVEFVYELVLASAAQQLAPWIAKNGRWFNRITGVTFVGIGSLLTTASRH